MIFEKAGVFEEMGEHWLVNGFLFKRVEGIQPKPAFIEMVRDAASNLERELFITTLGDGPLVYRIGDFPCYRFFDPRSEARFYVDVKWMGELGVDKEADLSLYRFYTAYEDKLVTVHKYDEFQGGAMVVQVLDDDEEVLEILAGGAHA